MNQEGIRICKSATIGLLVLSAGLAFAYYLVGNPYHEYLLITSRVTVDGAVVDLWEESENEGQGTKWLHSAKYSFVTLDGVSVSGGTKDRLGRLSDEWRSRKLPFPASIDYVPSNPSINRLHGDGNDSLWSWTWRRVGVGGFLYVLLASPGVSMLRGTVREASRLKERRTEA